MRAAFIAICAVVLLAGGCGYVGPVVPPSPKIPSIVTDLAVVERAGQLMATFTPPLRTTDDALIVRFSEIQLWVGPGTKVGPGGKVFEIPVPAELDKDDPKLLPVTFSAPAAGWTGQQVAVAVRSAVKERKNYSDWSNVVVLPVIAPLTPPEFSIEATAQGYKLTWPDEGPGVQYDVLRKGFADPKPVVVGTADKPEYVDTSAQWDTPYTYQIMAHTATAQSLPSAVQTVNHPDTFPPAVPSGLTGIATPDAIELSWERDTEPDLKGYYVYRSSAGGAFERIGKITNLPAYSDHAVEHGKTYRYRVNAIDQTGNFSEQSDSFTIAFP